MAQLCERHISTTHMQASRRAAFRQPCSVRCPVSPTPVAADSTSSADAIKQGPAAPPAAQSRRQTWAAPPAPPPSSRCGSGAGAAAHGERCSARCGSWSSTDPHPASGGKHASRPAAQCDGTRPCWRANRISCRYPSSPANAAVSGPGSVSRGGTSGRSPASTMRMIWRAGEEGGRLEGDVPRRVAVACSLRTPRSARQACRPTRRAGHRRSVWRRCSP